jgi:hypothetical protein
MSKFIIILTFLVFIYGVCYGTMLNSPNCSFDVTFNDDGSVKLDDIEGNCTVSFYSGNVTWGDYTYKNGKEHSDTFKCCFCPTTKVCVDDICVAR